MAMRLVLAAALGAAACAPAVAAAATPASLRTSILDAGRSQRSVHYRSSSSVPQITVSIDADAGLTEGVQRITFSKSGKTGHMTVLVSHSVAYIRGDAFTLRQYLGFKAAAANRYGQAWIAITQKSRLYVPIAAAVTLASAIDQLGPQGTLSALGRTTFKGVKVIALRGKATTAKGIQLDTLYARATGAPLPVEEDVTLGQSRFTIAFDRWNETVHVTVPKRTVPIATVQAAGSGPTA